jgi:alkaline phosphatase D
MTDTLREKLAWWIRAAGVMSILVLLAACGSLSADFTARNMQEHSGDIPAASANNPGHTPDTTQGGTLEDIMEPEELAQATSQPTRTPSPEPTAPLSPEPTAEPAQDGPANVFDEPVVRHGPMSGEVTDSSVVLWARGNITGTLEFELAETEAFTETVETATVDVDATHDFVGSVEVEELIPDRQYYYRVVLDAENTISQPVEGSFETAPLDDTANELSFVFSSCVGGQNYCRNEDTGWPIFETMGDEEPDFFLFTGDTIYADTACDADTNVPGAEGPFSDLEGFRTRYRYHLDDEALASFFARTPVYVTWDDHEILNDFGGPALKAVNPQRFEDGITAFFEYWPLMGTSNDPHRIYRSFSYGSHADFFILDTRSYRDPNINWDPHPTTLEPKTMLGEEQMEWLQQEISTSQATWKFIVTSVPLSYPTGFPQPQVEGRDGWANYTEPSGYENELLSLLFLIQQNSIENVVFIAGDTHWPYAISYDPDRNGEPDFHEFGASPLSAIPLAPPTLPPDPTFNPNVLYAEGEFQGDLFNFGHITVDEDGALTFRVVDWKGEERYSLTLQPE